MGQQHSKAELLYQQVSYGNADGIKALARDGARLEWVDREGKTPLILASMNPELHHVAKTLIELGANVNAYRPGRNGGTPLHHAAKRGLENTVKLLLTHGANPLVMNDDCQTPLEVARAKGYSNVVRAIENHICLFSGWMREFYGPGFLELIAPQFVSRNVWVVVLPTGSVKPTMPYKLELAIYLSLQDARPRTLIPLWKANLGEQKFHNSDPSVTIDADSTISRGRRRRRVRRRPPRVRQTHIRLAPANEGDKQQLKWFCDACKGITEVMHPPPFLRPPQTPTVQATAPPSAEDLELAMAINASLESAVAEGAIFDAQSSSEASASTSWNNSLNAGGQDALGAAASPTHQKATGSKLSMDEAGPSSHSTKQTQMQSNIPAVQTVTEAPDSVPLAPVITEEVAEDGPIYYPSIDSTPVNISSPLVDNFPAGASEKKEDGGSSSCVVCLDAPVEGACVPCGHMAGCMSCLTEIQSKKWGCPVCRAKINQVIRLYVV